MATSFWSKFYDILGLSTGKHGIDAMVNKDWKRAAFLNTPYGWIKDYIDNIKNWNNDSDISGANSASTVSNSEDPSLVPSKYGEMVNGDGSSNLSGLTSLDQLGPMLTEAVVGAIPEIQRQWSSAEATKERDWQTEMSNSAYQRSVADMKAAGINPILAYSQGGASSGVGASASAPSSANSLGSTIQGIGSIINSVLEKDMKSDAMQQKAVMEMLRYKDSHSATQTSNEYYKTLNKLNNMTLRNAEKNSSKKIGF